MSGTPSIGRGQKDEGARFGRLRWTLLRPGLDPAAGLVLGLVCLVLGLAPLLLGLALLLARLVVRQLAVPLLQLAFDLVSSTAHTTPPCVGVGLFPLQIGF